MTTANPMPGSAAGMGMTWEYAQHEIAARETEQYAGTTLVEMGRAGWELVSMQSCSWPSWGARAGLTTHLVYTFKRPVGTR